MREGEDSDDDDDGEYLSKLDGGGAFMPRGELFPCAMSRLCAVYPEQTGAISLLVRNAFSLRAAPKLLTIIHYALIIYNAVISKTSDVRTSCLNYCVKANHTIIENYFLFK